MKKFRKSPIKASITRFYTTLLTNCKIWSIMAGTVENGSIVTENKNTS